MREGRRVYDADTHVQPTAEALEPYLSARVRELVPTWTRGSRRYGSAWPAKSARSHIATSTAVGGGEGGWGGSAVRVLGDAGPREGVTRRFQKFMGSRFPTEGGAEDGDIRVRDMDEEGVDVHMMVPNGANGHSDAEVEMEFIRAQHRYLNDMCSPHPHRLKSLIVVQRAQYRRSRSRRSRPGPVLPGPSASSLTCPSITRSTTRTSSRLAARPRRITWPWCTTASRPATRLPGPVDSPFIGRSASHPGRHALRRGRIRLGHDGPPPGAAGRHPGVGLRLVTVRGVRMDDQMEYMGYVAEDLKHKPSEYMTSGRFFCQHRAARRAAEMMRMVTGPLATASSCSAPTTPRRIAVPQLRRQGAGVAGIVSERR